MIRLTRRKRLENRQKPDTNVQKFGWETETNPKGKVAPSSSRFYPISQTLSHFSHNGPSLVSAAQWRREAKRIWRKTGSFRTSIILRPHLHAEI